LYVAAVHRDKDPISHRAPNPGERAGDQPGSDGVTFRADRQLRFENAITIPSGRGSLTSGQSKREGVIVVGGWWRMAHRYQWVQRPTQ